MLACLNGLAFLQAVLSLPVLTPVPQNRLSRLGLYRKAKERLRKNMKLQGLMLISAQLPLPGVPRIDEVAAEPK